MSDEQNGGTKLTLRQLGNAARQADTVTAPEKLSSRAYEPVVEILVKKGFRAKTITEWMAQRGHRMSVFTVRNLVHRVNARLDKEEPKVECSCQDGACKPQEADSSPVGEESKQYSLADKLAQQETKP